MLNELLEYEEYQFSYYKENPNKAFRITMRNLGNDFTAVPRALEIIARYELYNNNKSLEEAEDREAIKKTLTSWLDELSHSKEINYLYTHRKKAKNGDDIYTALDKYTAHYKESSIERKFKNYKCNLKHNDINGSFFDKTIACAYNRGKLKNYILVQEGNPFDGVYRHEKRNAKPTDLNKGKKNYNHRDYILKFTAYYLLENTLNQDSVPLHKQWINNWSSYVAEVRYYYEDSEKNTYDIFTEIPVFESCNKYQAYKPWINKFSLQDITEPGSLEKWLLDPKNIDKTYYVDKGAHVNLERHIVADEV